MRVLFVIPHPREGASGRHRVFQYLPWLEQEGITYEVRPFMSPALYRMLYQPGYLSRKITMAAAAMLKRLVDVVRSARADVVVIHREALPLGTPWLERIMARLCPSVIFDFDDAIYLPAIGGRRVTRVLRNAREETIALCHNAASVLAGNRFLARFCESHGAAAVVLPTVVDTAVFQPAPSPPSRPAIVWVGSHSTERYIDAITEPLRRVCALTRARVKVVSQSARSRMGALDVEGAVWRLEDDARYFREATVGIYPLPDDEWSRGKCGLKALLFLASGVPVVASPVGVLQDMVIPGETGFLACTPEEWEQHLSTLLTNDRLRREMGARGRALVEERYSLEVGAEILAREIERVKRQRVTPRRPRANGMA